MAKFGEIMVLVCPHKVTKQCCDTTKIDCDQHNEYNQLCGITSLFGSSYK